MRLHARDFLTGDGATVPPEMLEAEIGVMDAPVEESCLPESAFIAMPSASSSE
jgi:hypothetical protein